MSKNPYTMKINLAIPYLDTLSKENVNTRVLSRKLQDYNLHH